MYVLDSALREDGLATSERTLPMIFLCLILDLTWILLPPMRGQSYTLYLVPYGNLV